MPETTIEETKEVKSESLKNKLGHKQEEAKAASSIPDIERALVIPPTLMKDLKEDQGKRVLAVSKLIKELS